MSKISVIRRITALSLIFLKHLLRYTAGRNILRLRRLFLNPDRYETELWRSRGRAARIMLEEMGATFIKLAQILSTRRDMFPPAALAELEKLQDDVPPFDGSLVPEMFKKEFGFSIKEVFSSFDLIPVASASVAQVHKAVLKDGREVAIKVLRPEIESKMNQDIVIINLIVALVARIPFYEARSLIGFTDYFGQMLKKQLDLTIEAENNRKYCESFAEEKHIVRCPELIPEYCSRNIMTMEFANGVKPTELDHSETDTQKLARTGLYLYYSMVVNGLIHADLHPGNMLVSPDSYFWIFDLGLVDEMDWELRKSFLEAWFSTFNGDGGPFARLMLRFSISHGVDDMEAFEADVQDFLKKFLADRIADLEFGGFMMAMGDLQRKYRIIADPCWTSIAISLVSIEGLARYFDPEMNIFKTISPHLKKLLRKLYLMDPKREERRRLRNRAENSSSARY